MSDKAPPFLVVGQLNKPHGTRGEIFVWPLTDHPASTFAPGVVLRLGDESGNRPDSFASPVTITSARPFKRGYLVALEGIEDRSGAERVIGRYLLRPFEEAQPLVEGEVFYHQLLDMAVITVEGEPVGRVVEVYDTQPCELLEVEGPDGRRRLVPLSGQIVRELHVEERRIVVDPPDGLLDL